MSSEFDFLLFIILLFNFLLLIIMLFLFKETINKINSIDDDLTILWNKAKKINKKKGGNEK